MKVSRIKNILIALLGVLCAFQTLRVWFGESMGRDVLNSIIRPLLNRRGDYDYSGLTKPYRFILCDGENFSLLVNDGKAARLNAEFTNEMSALFKRGEFAGTGEIDANAYFSSNSAVLCEYKFRMPSDDFSRAFSSNNNLLTGKTAFFDALVMSVSPGGDLNVYFLDYENETSYKYALKNSAAGNVFSAAEALPFMPCEGFPLFPEVLSGVAYPPVYAELAYADGDEIKRSQIEKNVGFFFNEPSRMTSDSVDGAYTFREGNAVVKYYYGNVLEYSNYSAGGGGETPFIADYSAAAAFLSADKTVKNDFFLSHYEENDAGRRFCFDFTVGGFPLTMTRAQQETAGMRYAAEITVKDGAVVKYRRLGYNFALTETATPVTLDFAEAYRFAAGTRADESDITRAGIAYSIDAAALDSELRLSWFFETRFTDETGAAFHTPFTYPAQ